MEKRPLQTLAEWIERKIVTGAIRVHVKELLRKAAGDMAGLYSDALKPDALDLDTSEAGVVLAGTAHLNTLDATASEAEVEPAPAAILTHPIEDSQGESEHSTESNSIQPAQPEGLQARRISDEGGWNPV
eukprot:Blabericola_migrator_1__6692@NODE_3384_length_1816_cov_7_972556_g2108_i0_p1_GENE_NODE_3384_length_1816_cov_7_972556_g2108_i0NODE_3384_length_1816_cov_7_972556_g2108_i0_p1_ORF_typecomplete_len130_score16_29_NODE_3384_length_1816_cov_7_972556_g2108_i013771766